MTTQLPAAASGQFFIGADLPVNRLGYGAMRITGEGIWGKPTDLKQARATLTRTRKLGVNFIDTADSYGPYVSEDLIREALHPYPDMVIATKAGQTRHGPNIWKPLGRPEYLRQCALMSLRRLGLERIDLWQLHRINPQVPEAEQFEVISEMRKEGLIRHVGLSEVSVAQIEAARKYFPVATVQNRYNLSDRQSEAVLDYCEQHAIGFIPWHPLAAGALAGPNSAVAQIARRLGITHGQLALAWLLKRSPVILPIPGTSRIAHLEQNVAAATVELSNEDFAAISAQAA